MSISFYWKIPTCARVINNKKKIGWNKFLSTAFQPGGSTNHNFIIFILKHGLCVVMVDMVDTFCIPGLGKIKKNTIEWMCSKKKFLCAVRLNLPTLSTNQPNIWYCYEKPWLIDGCKELGYNHPIFLCGNEIYVMEIFRDCVLQTVTHIFLPYPFNFFIWGECIVIKNQYS